MKILLVAGHGDGDPGACGNGYRECDLTRSLAQKIKNHLTNYAEVTIFDTNKNMYKYLKSGGIFDFSPYDYILEIHFNAANFTSANGTEILVHSKQKGVSVEEKILNNICKLGFRNRGIKKRSNLYNMNKLYALGKDYALIEVCFITNSNDIHNYNADQVAEEIKNGIVEGFGLQATSPSELSSINDIVWELAHRGIITNKDLWLKKLSDDINAYWLARKTVAYFQRENI